MRAIGPDTEIKEGDEVYLTGRVGYCRRESPRPDCECPWQAFLTARVLLRLQRNAYRVSGTGIVERKPVKHRS